MQVLTNGLQRTPVYDAYWRFACERQNVYFKRLMGLTGPWTSDHIITRFKFTNAYRALDRVSQFLISRVIRPDTENGAFPEDKVFRILVFKLFNKIETWQLLNDSLGEIRWSTYSFRQYDEVLNSAFQRGRTIYSAAYIMASGKTTFGHARKHQNHLRLIEKMMESEIPRRVSECACMADLYNLLHEYPLIGDFLAYQLATDINYSDVTDFSEEEFVRAGPGARDGIAKCFSDRAKYSDEEVIRYMMDHQEQEFRRLGLGFKTLFGRRLKLVDCQNLFCEIGKYARVSHPNIPDKSGRVRIKQVFRTSGPIPTPCFPEKWRLSATVEDFMATHTPDHAVTARGSTTNEVFRW